MKAQDPANLILIAIEVVRKVFKYQRHPEIPGIEIKKSRKNPECEIRKIPKPRRSRSGYMKAQKIPSAKSRESASGFEKSRVFLI